MVQAHSTQFYQLSLAAAAVVAAAFAYEGAVVGQTHHLIAVEHQSSLHVYATNIMQ